MAQVKNRKKVNFIIDKNIIIKIEQLMPAGKRSDFVNNALSESLIRYARKEASEAMDECAKQNTIRLTTAEIIKLKNHGRQ